MISQGSVSAIVVSYYTGEAIFLCLDSLLSEGVDEIVLINNGNSKADVERLSRYNKKIKFIDSGGNIGFSRACNLGAKNASGDILLFINPDCVLLPNSLSELLVTLNSSESIFMVGGCHLNPDGSYQKTSARNLLSLKSLFCGINLPKPEEVTEVPAITGALMMMKKSAFAMVGGFDESYFLHFEDLEMCRNVKNSGGRIVLNPKARVLHFKSTSNVGSLFILQCKLKSIYNYFAKTSKVLGLLVSAVFALNWLAKKPLGLLKKEFEKNILLTKLSILGNLAENNESVNKDKILITGASTPTGLAVIKSLFAEGYEVYAFTRRIGLLQEITSKKIKWIGADISKGFGDIISEADVLISISPIWIMAELVDYIDNLGIKRVVALSSTSAQTKIDSDNSDDVKLAEKLVKSEQKITEKCRELGINLTIIRPSMIYGYGLDKNISEIAVFLKRYKIFPFYKNGIGKRQPVHVDDIASAVVKSICSNESYGKTYSLGGSDIYSYKDMVDKIARDNSLSYFSLNLPFLPKLLKMLSKNKKAAIIERMADDMIFDNSAANKDFGYSPQTKRDFKL